MAKTWTANHLPRALREPAECNDLHSTLQRISADINQMINTFLALSECAPSPSNTGYTAYLESCLLHIRNLITFFHELEFEKITVRDFVRGGCSNDVIQAPDLAPVRDLIDQYLANGNRMRMVDPSLELDEILGSVVVTLAYAFESFLDQLPRGSFEKQYLENGTRVALGKVKRTKIPKSDCLIQKAQERQS